MKYLIVLCLIAYINAFPQKDGAQFTNEAIKQAQSQQLIPAGAQIQNVSTYKTKFEEKKGLHIKKNLLRFKKASN